MPARNRLPVFYGTLEQMGRLPSTPTNHPSASAVISTSFSSVRTPRARGSSITQENFPPPKLSLCMAIHQRWSGCAQHCRRTFLDPKFLCQAPALSLSCEKWQSERKSKSAASDFTLLTSD